MGIILHLLLGAIAVFVSAYVIPSVEVKDLTTALVVSIVLAVLNTFLKPILLLLTLPITILTLGLFTFVINVVLILIVSSLVPGFRVDGFISALLFSLALSLVSSALGSLA